MNALSCFGVVGLEIGGCRFGTSLGVDYEATNVVFCLLFVFSNIALADVIECEQLEIDEAWIKETPPNNIMTGGYLKIVDG